MYSDVYAVWKVSAESWKAGRKIRNVAVKSSSPRRRKEHRSEKMAEGGCFSRGEAIPLGDELGIKANSRFDLRGLPAWSRRGQARRERVFPRVYLRLWNTQIHTRARSVLFLASISGCSFSAKVSTAFVKIQCVWDAPVIRSRNFFESPSLLLFPKERNRLN